MWGNPKVLSLVSMLLVVNSAGAGIAQLNLTSYFQSPPSDDSPGWTRVVQEYDGAIAYSMRQYPDNVHRAKSIATALSRDFMLLQYRSGLGIDDPVPGNPSDSARPDQHVDFFEHVYYRQDSWDWFQRSPYAIYSPFRPLGFLAFDTDETVGSSDILVWDYEENNALRYESVAMRPESPGWQQFLADQVTDLVIHPPTREDAGLTLDYDWDGIFFDDFQAVLMAEDREDPGTSSRHFPGHSSDRLMRYGFIELLRTIYPQVSRIKANNHALIVAANVGSGWNPPGGAMWHEYASHCDIIMMEHFATTDGSWRTKLSLAQAAVREGFSVILNRFPNQYLPSTNNIEGLGLSEVTDDAVQALCSALLVCRRDPATSRNLVWFAYNWYDEEWTRLGLADRWPPTRTEFPWYSHMVNLGEPSGDASEALQEGVPTGHFSRQFENGWVYVNVGSSIWQIPQPAGEWHNQFDEDVSFPISLPQWHAVFIFHP